MDIKTEHEAFFITLMRFSRHGPLMQSFMLTSLQKYAESVLAAQERNELFESPVNAKKWADCATEALEKISKVYEQPSSSIH